MIAFPDDQFDNALPVVANLHYHGVQIRKDVENAYVSKTGALKNRLESLNLMPAALSFPAVSMDPAKRAETTALFREYAAFHRRIGGLYLQATDGGKPGADYSAADLKAFGDHLNELGRIADDAGLALGYHPHLNTFGETREGLDRVLASTESRHVKLIADVAHMTLGGINPADAIRSYHDRLLFLHFKDATREAAELARTDIAEARKLKVHFCEVGKGVVDFAAVLRAIDAAHFKGWIIVELDAYQPPPGGPAEAARTNRDAMRQMGFKL
jgi:inosose dehydratase